MKSRIFSIERLSSDIAIISYLAAFKLVIHFLTNGEYGYFRDELYFLACGEHLDWGYVDHPPLVAVTARASRWLLGDSLFAIRFFPALAGALKVLLTGLFARELGGGRFAQVLAAITAIIAPVYLGIDTLLSMNAFEPLFWTACAYIVLLILKGGSQQLWLLFGLIAGVGLLNKHSMIFFGAGIVTGLLVTPARRVFLSKWIYLGGLIAFVVFLPNLIWQVTHDWPTLELLRNVANSNKNVTLSPAEFILQQILIMHPLTFPVWLAGLYFYLVSSAGKPYRAFGWSYIATLVLFIALKGKNYYLAPIYPVLLAPGAVFIEGFIRERNLKWLKPAFTTLLIIGGIITALLALPALSVENYLKYSRMLGMPEGGIKTETGHRGKLPQNFGDMFGWEEMTATVARVYNSLPPEDQARCAIFGQNYGEAGAIDFFGPRYNLPKAISAHQNYYLWGPRDYTGEVMIVLGDKVERLKELFNQVEQKETIKCDYCMPYESNLPVFLCRDMKMPIKELWPMIKKWL